jgi:hypothetical protein
VKSQLVDLIERLLLDCGSKGGVVVTRDVKTLRARVEAEGDGFITITLPRYCRDFERCLDSGRLVPGAFQGFALKGSGIPAFCSGFLYKIFDRVGKVREDASIDCIRAIRQVCLFGKKVKRPCSPERELAAIERFKTCDDEVTDVQSHPLFQRYKRVAREILSSLDLYDPETPCELEVMPDHGPGAVRERVKSPNKKWFALSRWPARLQAVGLTHRRALFGSERLPFEDALSIPLDGDVDDSLAVTFVEPEDEDPVRVVFVPKTQTAPRVIAIEPCAMQFAQQGLWRRLREAIEASPVTGGRVNFTDQSVNQSLALQASRDRRMATIDMSDASDRVGLEHARALFSSDPGLWSLIEASRSRAAELPDGTLVHLKKFASMGSALCFPVEALVFFTSIVSIRLKNRGLFPTKASILAMSRDVYVYGDDLIVPADEAPAICEDLESFGFKVNRSKSFWNGNFRESCGVDAFRGELVTPVYLRNDVPADSGDVEGLLSLTATVRQLEKAGYFRCAFLLREAVEQWLGPLPVTADDSPAMGWTCCSDARPRRRWNRRLQRAEMRGWVATPVMSDDPLDGHLALAKCLRPSSGVGALIPDLVMRDAEHLSASPRRSVLALKQRWVPCT